MVLIPILSTLYGPKTAVPVLLLTDYVLTAPMAWRARRLCAWREIVPLTAGHVLALPIGLTILVAADAGLLTRAMGFLVLAVVVVMAFGYRRTTAPTPAGSFLVGNSAGFLSGAVGIGGPPVILFWLSGQDTAPRVRANIFVFFALTGALSFVGLTYAGLMTRSVLELTLALMPAYLAGLLVGARAFRGTGEEAFRQAALAIVAGVGILAVLAG